MKKIILLFLILMGAQMASAQSDQGQVSVVSDGQVNEVHVSSLGSQSKLFLKSASSFGTTATFFYKKEMLDHLGLIGDEKVISITTLIDHDDVQNHLYISNKVLGMKFFDPSFYLFEGSSTKNIDLKIGIQRPDKTFDVVTVSVNYISLRNSLLGKAAITAKQSISYEVRFDTSVGSAKMRLYPFNGSGGFVLVDQKEIRL